MKAHGTLILACFIALGGLLTTRAQSSAGTIHGFVADQNGSVVPHAIVSIKNTGTGLLRSVTTNSEGNYSFLNVPAGTYVLTVEAVTFAKYIRYGIVLDTDQSAVLDATLKPGTAQQTVTVTENASLVNATTPEIGTHIDSVRLAQLPIAADGNVYRSLLLAPGVGQAGANQAVTNLSINFTSTGSRLRSNNFTLDGQDINDPNITGPQMPLNNPDAINEVHIVTNQFLPEYGRNPGSVANFVTRSGTNEYHGSGFVFYNSAALNSCSNLDKAAGFCNPAALDDFSANSPPRRELRYGFTAGGPLAFAWFGKGIRRSSSTFIFGDLLKWTDRQLGSSATISGAPTATGRATLQQYFGDLPQVKALLASVPAGTSNVTTFTAGGQVIEVGSLTASLPSTFDATQGSIRIDHIFGARNLLYGRYRWGASTSEGEQSTPPGLSTLAELDTYAATVAWNSSISSQFLNDVQFAWTRLEGSYAASHLFSDTIPSIEITQLGMNGTSHVPGRTAFGTATNLPQTRNTDLYQIGDNVSYIRGEHSLKFGVDIHRRNVDTIFVSNTRGRLLYATLDDFINDRAQTAAINLPLKGGNLLGGYGWNETYAYVQDQWRIRPTLTLSFGLRYEYPGDSFGSLKAQNEQIVAVNGNDPAFLFSPQPVADTNNFMPRVGFSWSPQVSGSGLVGFLTGGNRTVIRAGYARSYDTSYLLIDALIRNSFPFIATQSVAGALPGFATIQSLRGGSSTVPDNVAVLLSRAVVAGDFRMPSSHQFSFDYQRELAKDIVIRVGYVGTFGIDPFTGTAVPFVIAPRVDASKGTTQLWKNSASSSYNALQTSFEKRFSEGVTANVYYTWSKFIDTASDIAASSAGDAAISMDSFNLDADRARSRYDYPHRLSANA